MVLAGSVKRIIATLLQKYHCNRRKLMRRIRLKSFMFLVTLALAVNFGSCKSNANDDKSKEYAILALSVNAPLTYNVTLTGAQEVPSVTTNGSGTLIGSYDKSTKTLSYTLTWKSLSAVPSAAHFHGPAQAGTNANVLIAITPLTAAADGTVTRTAVLTAEQEGMLLGGLMYVNVHTATNSAGEIRGQLSSSSKIGY